MSGDYIERERRIIIKKSYYGEPDKTEDSECPYAVGSWNLS